MSGVSIFNAASRYGPVRRADGMAGYVVLDKSTDWNAETFLRGVAPIIFAQIRAEAVEKGVIPVFMIDGERVHLTYPPGTFQPHKHNLKGPSRSDGHALFGLPPGEGYFGNASVAAALGVKYANAEELKAKLWDIDFVREQLTELECLAAEYGIIVLVTPPGCPAVNFVERYHRHMKYDNELAACTTYGVWRAMACEAICVETHTPCRRRGVRMGRKLPGTGRVAERSPGLQAVLAGHARILLGRLPNANRIDT